MHRAADASFACGALPIAGMRLRRTLKSYYGSPEKAEKAIREALKDETELETWATLVTEVPKEERASLGTPFRFSEIPPPMREQAKESMAAAMLAWRIEQEEEAKPA